MMPVRWPNYILVILTAFLGWFLPYVLPRLWRSFGRIRRIQSPTAISPAASNPTAAPISVRFHLAALLFLGFLGIALLALPLLFSIRTAEGEHASVLLAALAVPMVIVLFYCLRKGDLSWNATRTRDEGPGA